MIVVSLCVRKNDNSNYKYGQSLEVIKRNILQTTYLRSSSIYFIERDDDKVYYSLEITGKSNAA